MAAGVTAIREALETRLATYLGAGSRQVSVFAYRPEDLTGTYPAVCVEPGEGELGFVSYFESMSNNGCALLRFEIQVFVSGRYIDAQRAMDAFLSAGSGFTSSILNAILADPTLGGVVSTCRLLAASRPAQTDDDGSVWVSRLPLDVYTMKVAA